MSSHAGLRVALLSSTLFAALALFAGTQAQAQYTGSSHVGLMLGMGAGSGPAWDESSLYTQGTYDSKGTALGMVFALEGGNDPTKDGFGFSYYFTGTLGGINERVKYANLGPGYSAYDGVWGSDFDLIGDLRLGIAGTYRIVNKELLFSLRYFNWYNAGGLRAIHGNSDDPAALGVGVAWRRLGVDVDYGSDAIPGLLVASRAWSLLRIEARYKLSFWDEGKMSWLAGLRYEGSFLQESAHAGDPSTTVNSVIAFISMSGGK